MEALGNRKASVIRRRGEPLLKASEMKISRGDKQMYEEPKEEVGKASGMCIPIKVGQRTSGTEGAARASNMRMRVTVKPCPRVGDIEGGGRSSNEQVPMAVKTVTRLVSHGSSGTLASDLERKEDEAATDGDVESQSSQMTVIARASQPLKSIALAKTNIARSEELSQLFDAEDSTDNEENVIPAAPKKRKPMEENKKDSGKRKIQQSGNAKKMSKDNSDVPLKKLKTISFFENGVVKTKATRNPIEAKKLLSGFLNPRTPGETKKLVVEKQMKPQLKLTVSPGEPMKKLTGKKGIEKFQEWKQKEAKEKKVAVKVHRVKKVGFKGKQRAGRPDSSATTRGDPPKPPVKPHSCQVFFDSDEELREWQRAKELQRKSRRRIPVYAGCKMPSPKANRNVYSFTTSSSSESDWWVKPKPGEKHWWDTNTTYKLLLSKETGGRPVGADPTIDTDAAVAQSPMTLPENLMRLDSPIPATPDWLKPKESIPVVATKKVTRVKDPPKQKAAGKTLLEKIKSTEKLFNVKPAKAQSPLGKRVHWESDVETPQKVSVMKKPTVKKSLEFKKPIEQKSSGAKKPIMKESLKVTKPIEKKKSLEVKKPIQMKSSGAKKPIVKESLEINKPVVNKKLVEKKASDDHNQKAMAAAMEDYVARQKQDFEEFCQKLMKGKNVSEMLKKRFNE